MSALARPIDTEDAVDFAVACWAQRVIARSILWLDGEMPFHDAVDGAWEAAERVGLVDEFGADEIQAAMALVFGGRHV